MASFSQVKGGIGDCNVLLVLPSVAMASGCLGMVVGAGTDESDAAGASATGS